MGSKYRYITAVGQYDKNSCWAACLEWWLRATNLGQIYQEDVFGDYALFRQKDDGTLDDGTISRLGLIQLIEDPRWYMKRAEFTPAVSLTSSKLKELLRVSPVYIGFYDQQAGGNHVNVIYEVKGSGPQARVSVMEPAGRYDSSDHSFEGKHLTRRLQYYTAMGEIQIGTAKNYSSATGDESYYY